jgi:hypothetical protein
MPRIATGQVRFQLANPHAIAREYITGSARNAYQRGRSASRTMASAAQPKRNGYVAITTRPA